MSLSDDAHLEKLLQPGASSLGGRFRVLKHLGGGGMSQVYLAEQLSLGRQVVLKVLRQDVASLPEVSERFLQEARILSRIEHPAIVRVLDFEQSSEFTCLVLELAEGPNLEEVLATGPMAPERAQKLLLQLAEGLCVIHENNIIHRDLKPANVVLSPSRKTEQARLLDFGIAKLLQDNARHLSLPGQVVGTPAFLAPEQAMGKAVDARTDVYAFGLLAYRMLAGTLPFPGPSPRDYLEQHVKGSPAPLEQQRPELLAHRRLCELVMRCLEKEPARRPTSGRELFEALGALQNPFLTRPGQSGFHATSPRRQGALTALVTFCVFSLGVAFSFWLTRPSPKEWAERALERRAPQEAMPLIEKAMREPEPEPLWYTLQAVALHQFGQHEDESAFLVRHRNQAVFSAHPLLMQALSEDFARDEGNATLVEHFKNVPRGELQRELLHLAGGPRTKAQWGALRALDVLELAGEETNALYVQALDSPDCPERRLAARRLGERRVQNAKPALQGLSDAPKKRKKGRNCGQEEAEEALRILAE